MQKKGNVANFSIRLPEELLARLTHLAEVTHRPKSYYIIEAIKEHIEDMEDYYLAVERLTDRNAEYLTSEEAVEYLEL
jgi:RHH-type transcriptional regulator, rel operon repressor / antitoxin RelB